MNVLPIYGGSSVRPAAGRPQARRAGRRRHPGPGHRPPGEGQPRPLAPRLPGARRGRRDAADGLRRGRRTHPRRHPRVQAGGAVLGDHAARDPQDHHQVPARPRPGRRSKSKTATAENISQRYIQVAGPRKMDALTRLLEVEPFEAMIVFVRTKQATEEVAEKLRARGFSAAAINGDIAQAAARAHHRHAQGRDDRHPDRHRRRGARSRRRAHLARAELRHPARPGVLRAPHRAHRPGRAARARRCCSSRRASGICSSRSSG